MARLSSLACRGARRLVRIKIDFEPAFSSSYVLPGSRRPASGESSTAGLAILGSLAAAHLELPEATERVESNLAAGAFLELLDRLRDVLLQDAALLRREFPQHDLFNDPIFATSEYAKFEAAVTAAVGAARDEDPHLVAVQKALPAVCDSLRTVTGVVKTGLESNDSSMRCMNSSMQHMERRMATLKNVSCGTTTITDLWKEWTVGLGGQPSVEDLDERWGSRWRHGAEFQSYPRRKVVITEIKWLVAGGREAREVVDSLEAQDQGILESSDQRSEGGGQGKGGRELMYKI
ncbi:Transcriptional activator of glycolytic enzymes domain containing protein [Elaphomyces granulatus]